MCEVCQHNSIQIMKAADQYDPTRTTTLRNTFVRNFNRRFDTLAQHIKQALVDDDVFGTLEINQSPGRNAFSFTSDDKKVTAFLQWLQQQVNNHVFEMVTIQEIGGSIYPLWSNKFILNAYKRGVLRANNELRKAGFRVAPITGGLDFFMSPVHIERAGLLFIRNYNDLRGITDDMSKIISRILTQGMLEGTNPHILAKEIVASINGTGTGDLGLFDKLGRFIPAKRRAEILARTEIIRAHHLGTIQEYRNWGIAGLTVKAEFMTAGDNRVCPVCASLQGNVYKLDEAEGLIPVHPQCRCIMLPYGEGDTVQRWNDLYAVREGLVPKLEDII